VLAHGSGLTNRDARLPELLCHIAATGSIRPAAKETLPLVRPYLARG